MTATITQLPKPLSAMFTSLADEVLRLRSHRTSEEPEFHDAPEILSEFATPTFDGLPSSFQELLLLSVDPETFASLSVLNRRWRTTTSTTLFYSYHLAKCTASADEHQKRRWSDYKDLELAALKTLFAREAKRNLFSIYRQRHTTYRLNAPPDVSASAVPHGEAFSYAFSSKGSKLVVSSSSKMFVVNLAIGQPEVTAAFVLQRRPTAVAISDDGRTLAMLAPEWRINTFNIHQKAAHLFHTFLLDEPATALALSPDESLLVAAQSRGVEFFALDEVRGTAPRRKLACEPVSHLRFAGNGSFLLGTNIRSVDATTTVINAPSHMPTQFGDEDDEITSANVWLSQPLFPSSFGKTTHATPVPGDDSSIFAYDAPAETYGLLDFQKMKFVNSVVKAGGDIVGSAASVPSVTSDACLVALPISGQGLQVASLPLDRFSSGHQRTPSAPPLYQSEGQGDTHSRHHQRWIALTEKGLAAHWTLVSESKGASMKQRLTIVGSDDVNGKRRESAIEEPKDSGVIHFLDFGFGNESSERQEVNLDLSDIPTILLEEGSTANDAESALARQSLGSRASDNPRNAPLVRTVTSARKKDRRRSLEKIAPPDSKEPDDSISPEERHLDAPYHPSDPRPQGFLQRQSTAARARGSRPRSMPMDPREQMRNPSGRGEVPDESDADGWVPPPPEYVKETDQQLPDELQRTLSPPRVPERSPARKSASTPNLLLIESRDNTSQPVSSPDDFVPPAQPRPERKRTFVEKARRSIFGLPGLRKEKSSTLETTEAQTRKKPDSTSTGTPKESSDSRPSDNNIPAAVPRAANSRRNSIFDRPLSLYTQLRPANTRSVSSPLENRPQTPPSSFPALPQSQPESPTPPSPSQVERLHRRQASGSISSVRSDYSSVPRGAVGAHRRGTNTMPSPWASSLMLNTVDEDTPGATRSRPVSSYNMNGMYGSPGPSRPLSINLNGPGPSGMNGSSPSGTKAPQQETIRESRPPTRLQEASLESSRSPTSPRPNTADPVSKRRSFMPGSRLASIPSVGNMLSPIKSRDRSGKSPAAGVQGSGSKRLQSNGSVRKMGGDVKEKEGFKKKLARFKKSVIKNLESV